MEPMHILLNTFKSVVPVFGTRDQFHVDNFSIGRSDGDREDGLGTIQAHYICVHFISTITSNLPQINRH